MDDKQLLKQAEDDMFRAIQAIEADDLPFARSCSQAAAAYVTQAWQYRRRINTTVTKVDLGATGYEPLLKA